MSGKAEVFARTLLDRETLAESLRERIEVAKQVEQEALRNHVKKNPTVRAFGLVDSEASRARRKREKLEKELAGVEIELPILREAAVDAGRAQAELRLAEFEKAYRAVEATQPATWAALKEQYAAIVHAYVAAKAAVVQEQKRIDAEAVAAVENFGLREEWEQRRNAVQVHDLPSTWSSAEKQLAHALAEDEPNLARALREGSPATWISTGVGASLLG